MREIKIITTVTLCIITIIITCVICDKYNPSAPETAEQQKVDLYTRCTNQASSDDQPGTTCALIMQPNF